MSVTSSGVSASAGTVIIVRSGIRSRGSAATTARTSSIVGMSSSGCSGGMAVWGTGSKFAGFTDKSFGIPGISLSKCSAPKAEDGSVRTSSGAAAAAAAFAERPIGAAKGGATGWAMACGEVVDP